MFLVAWFVILCAWLYVSLGHVVEIPRVFGYQPKPLMYTSMPDYYADTKASLGVFHQTIEPMAVSNEHTPATATSNAQPTNRFTDTSIPTKKPPSPNVAPSSFETKSRPNVSAQASNVSTATGKMSMNVPAQEPSSGIASTCGPYGCCPSSSIPKNKSGSNCSACGSSKFGCCPDGVTPRTANGCPAPYSCGNTQFGCCPDGTAKTDDAGSNCSPYPPVYTISNTGSTNTGSTGSTSTGSTGSTSTGSTGSTSTGSTGSTSTGSTSTGSTGSTSTGATGASSDSVYVSTASDPSAPYSAGDPYATVTATSYSTPTTASAYEPQTNTVFLTPPKNKYKSECPEPEPCRPCGRCPAPAFDCKKVPNYANMDSDFLPVPISETYL